MSITDTYEANILIEALKMYRGEINKILDSRVGFNLLDLQELVSDVERMIHQLEMVEDQTKVQSGRPACEKLNKLFFKKVLTFF